MPNNTIIFGDSYSTFQDYIPEGYAVYYTPAGRAETDVTQVEETWWHQVTTQAGLHLVQNNSWSGSTIGYTGYGNSDCSHSSSFIFRLRQLKEQGFFQENEINTVFVFGGTNDSWSDAPLGVSMPENQSEADLFSVLPAISHFLTDLKETLPAASITHTSPALRFSPISAIFPSITSTSAIWSRPFLGSITRPPRMRIELLTILTPPFW